MLVSTALSLRSFAHSIYLPRVARVFRSFPAAFIHWQPRRPNASPLPQQTRPRDQDIPYGIVTLVDPKTGRLTEARTLSDLLGSIDREKQFVELVRAPRAPQRQVIDPELVPNAPAAPSSDDSTNKYAIVKIISKSKRYHWDKEHKKRMRSATVVQVKEIQLTWSVAEGDLAHKIRKIRRELEKRSRINLVFAPKARTQIPSQPERDKRVEHIMDSLKDLAREQGPRKIKGSVVILALEPVEQSSS